MREFLKRAVVVIAALVAWGSTQAAESAGKPPAGPAKVVYHINDADAQAVRAMEYIRNHLEVEPQAKIVVVAHARGVDFLMRGAKTRNGNLYATLLEDLLLQGVRFEVCEITLRERQMTRSQFLPEVTFVPSGVAEIARLQQREGYAYLRP